MLRARLIAAAYYLPQKTEDNEFLVKDMGLEWSAEDIFTKTGICSRHIAGKNEYASDLAVCAAEKLFAENANIKEKLDFILFCSQSPDYALPATACILQNRLGLSSRCGAIDINQGCSGFIYGLSLAKGLVEGGIAKNVLLITAETYSKYIDPKDKATRTIFGDAAAAVVVSGEEADIEYISNFVFGTDGSGMDNLIVRNSGARMNPSLPTALFMNGPEIFQFTLKVVPKAVKEILDSSGENIDGIDKFLFHQANAFILEHLRKKLKIDDKKFVIDLANTGNTVSASIPIAIAKIMEHKNIKENMKILALGFGVGYSWGGCLIRI